MVDQILEKYPNDVRVVIKNFPLGSHKQANKAALYALAAGRQGKYKEMYKKIFDNYKQLRNNEDLPLQYAEELGLNINQIKSDIKDPALQRLIDLEASQLKGTGMRMAVPKFLINGKEPQGRDLNAWSSIIDGYLKK
ncbi:MAG: thioredoxin domain-containing protein [Candidatus Marinimicrobia bacterium]|nr:thioredoxin domain-containing protein [Candidatus Neomarinimicrobiota bacterium]